MRIQTYLLAFAAGVVAAIAAEPSLEIKVNQAGYLPGAPKIGLVAAAKAEAAPFVVKRAQDDKAEMQGKLSPARADADSGDTVQIADFTSLKKPGQYYLEVPGVGRSWTFSIAADVYSRPFYLAMRSFYAQRCGTAVDLGPEFPGFKHAACHLKGAYHASSGKSGEARSEKGWHDAGDYGRYIVNSGITTGTLLWTYELFPKQVAKVKLNIPESGNGTPDILNEIRWNLDWMLTMQDADGGVWHKQTSEKFCGFVMPEKDTLVSHVIGSGKEPFKTSCSTADYAAVMAIAARVYKPFDPAYAARTLDAARRAWVWLAAHPGLTFNNPKDVSTGAYGDRNCGDEALWAAAELWRTTRESGYQKYFADHYAQSLGSIRAIGPQSWSDLAAMGLYTYALADGPGAEREAIQKAAVAAADAIVARTAQNGYRHSLASSDYIWGSNAVAANYGLQLLVANVLAPNPRYMEAALDNLHYLLGRNALSLSFVTQVGQHAMKHPHHRPSGADSNSAPWPGLLSGGPNGRPQDPAMRKLGKLPPARMFLDEEESYASNEVAINWNSPLVFLLAGAMSGK